jgi:hypothetical protein
MAVEEEDIPATYLLYAVGTLIAIGVVGAVILLFVFR